MWKSLYFLLTKAFLNTFNITEITVSLRPAQGVVAFGFGVDAIQHVVELGFPAYPAEY